jgi:hypothetical protein
MFSICIWQAQDVAGLADRIMTARARKANRREIILLICTYTASGPSNWLGSPENEHSSPEASREGSASQRPWPPAHSRYYPTFGGRPRGDLGLARDSQGAGPPLPPPY